MHLHILGICGTFMGGIALLARALGHRVTGSDANVYPPMSTQLEAAGIGLMEGYAASHLDPAPDLVVTDLYMPVMDGFHLVEKMRLLQRTRDTPVIVISAAGEDAESRARQLGVSAFLHKPVQLAAIVDAVRRLLASHA